MASSPRAFVLRHTRLRLVPGLEEIRLHLADDVLPLWRAVQVETNDEDAALPYWAFAWAGGLAIGRYLRDHPEVAVGRRVFDVASGSGLCAIAAMDAGAAAATGADIDAFAAAAIEVNARANGRRVTVVCRDVLDEEPPEVDVILAGDSWYESRLAGRVMPWLRRARDRGIDVLVGDPGRRYLPTAELVELASYEVRTTTELEDLEHKHARVYALRPAGATALTAGLSRASPLANRAPESMPGRGPAGTPSARMSAGGEQIGRKPRPRDLPIGQSLPFGRRRRHAPAAATRTRRRRHGSHRPHDPSKRIRVQALSQARK